MSIAEKLYEKALEHINENTYLKDFVIGIGMTAALLDDGRAGVVFTNKEDTIGKCEEFYKCINLEGYLESKVDIGMKVKDLLKIGLFTPDPLLRSVAYAALNAIFNNNQEVVSGDALKFLEIKSNDIVGMVGEIEPFIPKLKAKAWDVLVFERKRRSDAVHPDWAIVDLLPKCTVVILTGVTVVNGTIDWILNYINTDRVAIVGPSTPLVKGVIPVKVLSGVRIKDAEKLFYFVARGGGTRILNQSGATEKVNILQS